MACAGLGFYGVGEGRRGDRGHRLGKEPEEHEAHARGVLERLRIETEQVAETLATADHSLSRLVIARETVAEVLDEAGARGQDAVDRGGGRASRGLGRDVAL
jgi:hypothetical protein